MSSYISPSIVRDQAGPPLSTVKPRRKEVLSGADTEQYLQALSLTTSLNPSAAAAAASSSSSSSSYSSSSSSSSSSLTLESPMDGVFYIDGVVSAEECVALREKIDSSNALSFWCADKESDQDVRSFRNAYTIEMFSHEFAEILWNRVKHLLIDKINVDIPDDSDNEDHERELVGLWEPRGMNPDNLFVRYPTFGSFAPHTDGRATIDFNHRSHYTALLYFNTVPFEKGAGTRFYDKSAVTKLEKRTINDVEYWTADESLVTNAVAAVEGRLLIFHQSLVHEGIPPIDPFLKYILRSDVIFERVPLLCDTERDREAFKIFKQAEDLAENGDVDAAVPLFKRAFKLSPEMARIMGQA